MHQHQALKKFLGMIFWVSLLATGCAKPYHFYVRYDLPEPSSAPASHQINLQIHDQRPETDFLTAKARAEFDRWDGNFALYHGSEKPEGDTQTYSLSGVIKAAMQKRLHSMGIEVLEDQTAGVPLLEITLQAFQLDLKNRTWVSELSYEVRLTSGNPKTGLEKVSAKGERTKIMGRGAGEVLVGDIFTESINKLDIEKLFKNAGLS